MRNFAEDRNFGEIGSNVVVKVGGYARANPLEFDQSSDSIPIERISSEPDKRSNDGDEPPALPDGRKDLEREDSGNVAHYSICVDRAHRKAIAARRKVGEVHP